MEHPTYIVDGNALVDNIHFIKKCVYNGLFNIHIPTCAAEIAEKLYQKSLEPKEAPKNDKPKRWSGRPRREQQPLFDINPRTTTEFLERIRSEKGVPGVTLQLEGEEFTQWREEQEAAAKIEEKPQSSPFQEALLRKLNIKDVGGATDDAPDKPKLVVKSANGNQSPLKHQTTPSIPLKNIPHGLQPLFSCVLWRLHKYENNHLNPEKYVLLLQDQAGLALARSNEIPVSTLSDLRVSVARQLLSMDTRGVAGELEEEFPDAPRRETPLRHTASGREVSTAANGSNGAAADEAERALEAVALSVVQGLDQPDSLDVESERQLTKILAAELRPSISYAMAAGSTPATPKKPASSPLQQQQQQRKTIDPVNQPIASPQTSQPVTIDEAPQSPVKTSTAADSEVDSDEDVVVFNPKARQAAQANKKRRSHEVSKPASRPVSRPTTATATTAFESAVQPNSPRLTSAILNSVLKPQSPVFSPRQIYVASSPVMQSSLLASPGLLPTAADIAVSPASPLQRTTAASPQPGMAKQPPNGPRHGHASGQSRPVNQEAMQRQSEMILQRQREAIKRSAQAQDSGSKANRSPKDTAGKAPPREVEMRPTDNPVVIDPDDFGRDYTIKPTPANDNHGGRSRGEGRGKRGGRGRSKPQQPEGARGADVDFVLKSGNPRGAARGKGKLWVP